MRQTQSSAQVVNKTLVVKLAIYRVIKHHTNKQSKANKIKERRRRKHQKRKGWKSRKRHACLLRKVLTSEEKQDRSEEQMEKGRQEQPSPIKITLSWKAQYLVSLEVIFFGGSLLRNASLNKLVALFSDHAWNGLEFHAFCCQA